MKKLRKAIQLEADFTLRNTARAAFGIPIITRSTYIGDPWRSFRLLWGR